MDVLGNASPLIKAPVDVAPPHLNGPVSVHSSVATWSKRHDLSRGGKKLKLWVWSQYVAPSGKLFHTALSAESPR
jgi:hypothetical protein